jgi:hypothetical protein
MTGKEFVCFCVEGIRRLFFHTIGQDPITR